MSVNLREPQVKMLFEPTDNACCVVYVVMTTEEKNIDCISLGDFSSPSLRFGRKQCQRQILVPIMMEQLFWTTVLLTDNSDKLWAKSLLENGFL